MISVIRENRVNKPKSRSGETSEKTAHLPHIQQNPLGPRKGSKDKFVGPKPVKQTFQRHKSIHQPRED